MDSNTMTECNHTECPLWTAGCDRQFEGGKCGAYEWHRRNVSGHDLAARYELQLLKARQTIELLRQEMRLLRQRTAKRRETTGRP